MPHHAEIVTSTRSRSALAWLLWLTALSCSVGGLLAVHVWTGPLTLETLAQGAVVILTLQLGLATVGLLLALRRPGNPIGRLYLATGLVWSLWAPSAPWLDHLIAGHHPLPLAARLAAASAQFYWAPAIALGVTLPALLLPDGQLRSPRWRIVMAASVTGAAAALVGGSLTPGRLDQLPIGNPLGCRARLARRPG
jgi:hypothetical protein